jgi:hypothetical protein
MCLHRPHRECRQGQDTATTAEAHTAGARDCRVMPDSDSLLVAPIPFSELATARRGCHVLAADPPRCRSSALRTRPLETHHGRLTKLSCTVAQHFARRIGGSVSVVNLLRVRAMSRRLAIPADVR